MKTSITHQIIRRTSTITAVTLIIFILTACQPDIEPTVTPSPVPPPLEASPTINPAPPTPMANDFSNLPSVGISNPTAAAQANNADVGVEVTLAVEYSPELLQVQTTNGSPLNAELYLPTNLASNTMVPGVLIVSAQFNDWRGFPLSLREAGMAVLQVETRIPALEGDAASMLNTLVAQINVDPNRLAVIGAQEGAAIALAGCAEDTRCLGAALLTPAGQTALVGQMSAFGSRELWIAVTQEDSAAVLTAEALRQSATGTATLQTLQEAGSGTQMLFSQPQVEAMMINWLRALFTG